MKNEITEKLREQTEKVGRLEQDFIKTYREINGSYDPAQDGMEIYHYARETEDWLGGDPQQKLMEIAHKWKSAYEGLKVFKLIRAQQINTNALNQYRNDLQR